MAARTPLDAVFCCAVDTPAVRVACRHLGVRQLPIGLPFLVSAQTSRVIEPVLAHMADRYLVRELPGRPARLRWTANTREATVRDLKDFCDFLDANELGFQELSVEALNTYAGSMLSKTSPTTGKQYAFATVTRRMSNVGAFASWLQDDGRLRRRLELRNLAASVARCGSSRNRVCHDLSLRGFGRPQDIIEVLSRTEAKALLQALGPLPSGRIAGEHSRDRLAATIALNVGLRLSEVSALPIAETQKAISLAKRRTPFQMVPVRIYGKGRKWRKVNVPSWVLHETAAYIEGERAEAITEGMALYEHTFRPPINVFVGHQDATTSRGCDLSSGAIYDAFAAPQRGLMEAGSLHRRFRFHDLRHTYAVWTWIIQKRRGDPQPSKYVQAQLGHVSRETTEGIYLATVSLFEGQLFDDLANYLEESVDGQ